MLCKYLIDNNNNKIWCINSHLFVLGHYMLLKARSFPPFVHSSEQIISPKQYRKMFSCQFYITHTSKVSCNLSNIFQYFLIHTLASTLRQRKKNELICLRKTLAEKSHGYDVIFFEKLHTGTFRLLQFVPQSICAKFHFWGQISVDGRSKLNNKFVSVFKFILGSVEHNLIKAANNTKLQY